MRLSRIAAIASLVTLLVACEGLIGVEARLERAEKAFAEGSYAVAMTEVKTALEKEPEHAVGRILLARVLLRLGDAVAARTELDRAIGLGAESDLTRELHYEILAGEGHYQDVVIAAAADEELDAQLRLRLRARSEIALGQPDKAREIIRQALAANPQDDEAAFIEAGALWASGQHGQAIEVLTRLLERRPDQARWWLYRGGYAMSLGQAAAARDAFQKARQGDQGQLTHEEQLAVITGLVEANLATGEIPAAEQALEELDRRAPDSFVALFQKGRLAFERGDYDVAISELQRALVAKPGVPFARLLLAAALLQQGAIEQANVELTRLLAEVPGNIDARAMLARAHLARNDMEGARRLLADLPPEAESHAGANWIMGNILLQTGQSDEALALLSATVARDPQNVSMQLDLVRALLSVGRIEEAAERLAALPRDQGGRERQYLTVIAAVRGRPVAEGRQRAVAMLAEHRDQIGIQTGAGTYLLSVGDNDAALGAFTRSVELGTGDVEALLGLAATELRRGDAVGAESSLRKALAANAGDERVLLALADVAMLRRNRAAARDWLEQAISENPGSVEARLRLAEISFLDKDLARAESLLGQSVSVARDKAATRHRIGLIHARQANFDKALTYFSEAAAQGVQAAGIGAARVLIALGRAEDARSRLEAEIRRYPTAPMPVAMLASMDAAEQRFDRAHERVAAFEKAGGAASDAAEIRGDIQRSAGQPAEATASYAKAAQLRPSEMLAIKEFQAQIASGARSPEGVLQRWLEANPQTPNARYLLAEHYQRQGRRADAIAQYEATLRTGSHVIGLNNLAVLYQEAKDPRAVATARKAYDLEPENPAVADTYGWILIEEGKSDEGLRLLEAALRAAPANPDIRYHHAAALARAGRSDEAIQALRKLLDSAPEFPSRADAGALLQSLTGD